jgi:hypothetical protein
MIILRMDVCIQHMVASLSVSGRGGRTVHRLRENSRGRTVHRLRENSLSTCVLYDHHGHSQRVTMPYAIYIQSDLLRMSIILLEDCNII